MNMKKIALVLAGIACVAGSTSFAADTMTIKSSNRDSYAEVLVLSLIHIFASVRMGDDGKGTAIIYFIN